MPPSANHSQGSEWTAGRAWFATTHWTVVLAAGRCDSTRAAQALEELCRTYWYPLYAYVRRQGRSPHDAQDLTQEFFARFLAKNYLTEVSRDKGRFRSFLLAALKHFLANEWDKAKTVKRGGSISFIPWDEAEVENRYQVEPTPELGADQLYERQWALTLIDRVFGRLGEECITAGKGELFEKLRIYLSGEKSAASYAVAAEQLQMTAGAVQVAVHRLRRRYGELLRAEIAQTVERPEDIDGEIRHLFAALRV